MVQVWCAWRDFERVPASLAVSHPAHATMIDRAHGQRRASKLVETEGVRVGTTGALLCKMARIVIDAGHGGSSRAGSSTAHGVRGPSGALEKEVTLALARDVVARLGAQAELTRDGDYNLPLGARATQALRGRAEIFVSLHANGGAPEQAGPETWVHPEAGVASHRLAHQLQQALSALTFGARAEPQRAPMAVLHPDVVGRQTAACLVEVDYLSNPQAEQRLLDPRQRARLGAAIAGAIEAHLAGTSQRLAPSLATASEIDWANVSVLRTGMVVHVEVRASGVIEPMSRAYPLDVNGRIRLPMLGLVDADGLTLQQLGARIQALLAAGFLQSPTVNVTLRHRIVAYGALITEDRLYLRLLQRGGEVEPESGWYPVRNDGTLNLPYVGVVMARGRRLDEVEAQIEAAMRNQYVVEAVVHVTPINLDL